MGYFAQFLVLLALAVAGFFAALSVSVDDCENRVFACNETVGTVGFYVFIVAAIALMVLCLRWLIDTLRRSDD